MFNYFFVVFGSCLGFCGINTTKLHQLIMRLMNNYICRMMSYRVRDSSLADDHNTTKILSTAHPAGETTRMTSPYKVFFDQKENVSVYRVLFGSKRALHLCLALWVCEKYILWAAHVHEGSVLTTNPKINGNADCAFISMQTCVQFVQIQLPYVANAELEAHLQSNTSLLSISGKVR